MPSKSHKRTFRSDKRSVMELSFNHKEHLSQFLAEDIGCGDVTSALLEKTRISAKIISRERAVVAGANHVKEIFKIGGCSAIIVKKDGTKVLPGQTIIKITGDAEKILACERTALNLLARMSGIATQTSHMVEKIPSKVKLYATRKTAPGLRYFDKEAVEAGGGKRHRLRLDEMIMIKDNHIAVEGSLLLLIRKARKKRRKFEVEVENTADALFAARGGAAIIMLDNFTPRQIIRTIEALKKERLRGRVVLEASGGITARNIARYGRTGVDIISMGSITSSVRGIDMSLEV